MVLNFGLSLSISRLTMARISAVAARAAGPRADGRRRRFYVFSRAGRPCLDCGAAVLRENFGSRRLYFCPRCQPEDSGAS